MKRKIGMAMYVAPFAVLAVITVAQLGFFPMLAIFGGVSALVVWIGAAVLLMDGDL